MIILRPESSVSATVLAIACAVVFDAVAGTRVRKRCFEDGGSKQRFRTLVPATASKTTAQAMARTVAETELSGRRIIIGDPVLVQGDVWRISVNWLPRSPDATVDLQISADDGKLVTPFSLAKED